MPRVPYVGINDKAKKVKKMYIGVNDKARKVLKAYVGVNGIARIFYTADWWIPYGLKEANCIAAWQFYHAANNATARRDITGHGHNIVIDSFCSWSYDSGYYVTSGTNSSGLHASPGVSGAVTGVFWYIGLPMASEAAYDGGRWLRAEGPPEEMMAGRIGKISGMRYGEGYIYNESMRNYPGFCFSFKPYESWNDSAGYLRGYRGNSELPSSGIVTFDRSYPQIYVNGNAIGVTYFNINLGEGNINNMPVRSDVDHNVTIGGGTRPNMYIRAAAYFNCQLTSRQHSDLAKALSEVK